MKTFCNPLFLYILFSFLSYNAPISFSSASSSRSPQIFRNEVYKENTKTQGAGELYEKSDSQNEQSSNGPSTTKKTFIVVLFALLTGISIYNFIYRDFSVSNDIKI